MAYSGHNIGGWSFGGHNEREERSPWSNYGASNKGDGDNNGQRASPLRWHPSYFGSRSQQRPRSRSMANLEAIDEEHPGHQHSLYPNIASSGGGAVNNGFSGSIYSTQFPSRPDYTKSLFDTRHSESESNSERIHGKTSGQKDAQNIKSKKDKEKKNGKDKKRGRSRSVDGFNDSGGFYDAYSDAGSQGRLGMSSNPGGAPLPTVSGELSGLSSARRSSHGNAGRRSSQGSVASNLKGGKSPLSAGRRNSGATNHTSLMKDDADSSRGGGGGGSSSVTTTTAKNNNNNNTKNNNNNLNIYTPTDNSSSKSGMKPNNIKRSQSNDDIVSSILAASEGGAGNKVTGNRRNTLTFVGPYGLSTVVDIPVQTTTRTRCRKLLSPIITLIIVLVMLGAVAAAVYFAVEVKDSQKELIDILEARVQFLLARNYQTRDYSSLTSAEARELKSAYCQEVDALYARSALGQDYRGCELYTLTNERIEFTIFFVETPVAAKQEDAIVQVFAREGTTTGRQGEKILTISDISLDVREESTSLKLTATVKDQDFYGADSRSVAANDTPQEEPKIATVAPQSEENDEVSDETVLDPDICASILPENLVAHPHHCTHYIQCNFNQPVVMPCDGGLVFDPQSKACVKPREDLPCREITPCENLNGGHFAHPTNCRLFVQCDQGQSKVLTCNELVWDDASKNCRPKKRGTQCDFIET